MQTIGAMPGTFFFRNIPGHQIVSDTMGMIAGAALFGAGFLLSLCTTSEEEDVHIRNQQARINKLTDEVNLTRAALAEEADAVAVDLITAQQDTLALIEECDEQTGSRRPSASSTSVTPTEPNKLEERVADLTELTTTLITTQAVLLALRQKEVDEKKNQPMSYSL